MSGIDGKRDLEPGARVVILGRGGAQRLARVERVEADRIWFRREATEVSPGELVVVEHRIPGDARYKAEAKVELLSPDTFVVKRIGDWERDQRRSFVRITTYGIDVIATQLAPDTVLGKPRGGNNRRHKVAHSPRPFPMIDVSAGGTRFQALIPFDTDDEVICRFELPGEEPLTLPARVVRVESGGRRRVVAVEFQEIDEEQRSTLTQWVFREQVSRHKRREGGGGEI